MFSGIGRGLQTPTHPSNFYTTCHGKTVRIVNARQVRLLAFVEDKAAGGAGAKPSQSPSGARQLVVLDYRELAQGKNLSLELEQALGPDGLGALVVCNVPGYIALRKKLLPLAATFADFPEEVKAKYVDAPSHFSVGWSHGQEFLTDGKRDTNKGSYYANILVDDLLKPSEDDVRQPWKHEALRQLISAQSASPELQLLPCADASAAQSGSGLQGRVAEIDAARAEELRKRYPGYYRPNLWPREELPELEGAMKNLGRLIVAVGCLLADRCDMYVSERLGTPRGQLAGVLLRSTNPKARLLHYFAVPEQLAQALPERDGNEHEQPWCGWHTDHGSLTGLTSAMYLDAAGREVPCPDPKAGLYIRDRNGNIVRAAIPPDCIAFQVGEAMQVHSGGLLRATPHYVRAAMGPAAAGVSRNTYAVFMQPNVEEPMDCPEGVDPQRVAVGQWRPGHTFGEFAEATFERYYPKQ